MLDKENEPVNPILSNWFQLNRWWFYTGCYKAIALFEFHLLTPILTLSKWIEQTSSIFRNTRTFKPAVQFDCIKKDFTRLHLIVLMLTCKQNIEKLSKPNLT